MIWLYALVSLVPVTANHISWAMYIEMSENIVRISSKDSGAEERALNDISQTLGRILANMSSGGAVRMDKPWECQSCGKVNPPDARFCQKCGNPKNCDPVKTENLGNTGITRGF
ncbi:MAG: zinc ribbon domain-containing protein [Oscillospiraceae bacterium]